MKPSVTTALFQTNGPRTQLETGQFELRVGTVRVDEAYHNARLELIDRSSLRAGAVLDVKVMSVYARRDNPHCFGVYALLRANSEAVARDMMATEFGVVGDIVGVVNSEVSTDDLANISITFQVDEVVLTAVPVVEEDDLSDVP